MRSKKDIDMVYVLSQLWDLPLNIDKLVRMHLGNRTTNQHNQFNEIIIQQEAVHKDLGVIVITFLLDLILTMLLRKLKGFVI